MLSYLNRVLMYQNVSFKFTTCRFFLHQIPPAISQMRLLWNSFVSIHFYVLAHKQNHINLHQSLNPGNTLKSENSWSKRCFSDDFSVCRTPICTSLPTALNPLQVFHKNSRSQGCGSSMNRTEVFRDVKPIARFSMLSLRLLAHHSAKHGTLRFQMSAHRSGSKQSYLH